MSLIKIIGGSDFDGSGLFSIFSVSYFRELIKELMLFLKGNIKESQDKGDTQYL